MNPELWMVFVAPVSAMLFALGGTEISHKMTGQKWVRRFLLPSFFLLVTLLAKFAWWQALLVFVISCVAFHLGYGDRTSWKIKILVFLSYGLVSLPLGVSFWNSILVLIVPLMMVLSQINLTRNIFVWKTWELTVGFLIGISLSFILSGNGLIWGK